MNGTTLMLAPAAPAMSGVAGHIRRALLAVADDHALSVSIRDCTILAQAAATAVQLCEGPVQVKPTGRVKPTGEDLTPQELAALQCLANGLSRDEIAGVTAMRPGAVAKVLQSLARCLGTKDRAQTVAVAFKIGLLTAADVHLEP